MLRYTLRQLDYFVAAAECGSVARAAARLNVAQPSVSNAIAKLERQFAVQLFVRQHAQGVLLTPVGQRLLVEARNLLRHARDLQQSAEAAGDLVAGQLDIGCFITLAPVFMPGLITDFTEDYPGITIRLVEGVQDELLAGLLAGRFELAFLYNLEIPKEIEAETLASHSPYVLLPEGHPLARRKAISLAHLSEEPLILLDVPPSRSYFTDMFRQHGLEPRIAFSSPSLEMVRGLVGRGQGYSILVTRPHGDHTYDGQGLAIRPIAEETQPGEICLARLRQSKPTRLTQVFAEFCRAWFGDQQREPTEV